MSEDDLLLDQQLCFKLYTASRLIIRRYRPMLEALGITYPQYLVLLVLWEWQRCPPVQCTVKALGQRLLLDSGTLTPLLKRLQSLGLLTRQRDREDERAVCLQLTAAGLAMREQAIRLRQQLLCQQGLDTPAMQAWRLALGEQLQPLLALADEAPGSV